MSNASISSSTTKIGTIISGGTNNAVLYINNTGKLACNYAFTWDASTLAVGHPDDGGARSLYVGSGAADLSKLGLFHTDYSHGWSWVSDPVEADLRLKYHFESASGSDCLIATAGGNFNIVGALSIGTTSAPSGATLQVVPGSTASFGAIIRGDISGLYAPLKVINAAASLNYLVVAAGGKVGLNTDTPTGQLTIERNNTDYTNTAGAGTHLLLTNANAAGITGIMALVNGANSFKIRGNSSGNLTWVSYANSASTGHFFYVNGDFGTGSCWMLIANKGVVIGSAAASVASQAWLTLTVGGAGANQAPLKFQDSSGTVLATPEAGAVEFSSNRLYITNSTPTRKTIAYTDDAMPGTVPVGGVVAWLKSYTNTPALSSWFVECNGQTLSDAASVYNGQVIPNLNGSSSTKRFLRGSTTSGTTGGSETHSHTGTTSTESALANADTNGDGSQISFASGCHTHTFTTSSESTLPSYYEVLWIMRVK